MRFNFLKNTPAVQWKWIFVGCCFWNNVNAQPPVNTSYLGTKTPYQLPKQAPTPAPAGYQPVFINHVGRHGARYLTKAGADIEALKLLDEAAEHHDLTHTGMLIRQMVQRMVTLEKGNYENISILGATEQAAIGERMQSQYGPAFTGRGIRIAYTHKKRTRQSADAFLKSFSNYSGKLQFEEIPDSLDAALRFYDLSPVYNRYKKSQPVLQRMDSLRNDPREARVVESICDRVFVPGLAAKIRSSSTGSIFAGNLFDLYTVQFSLEQEMKWKGFTKDSIDLGIVFDDEALAWMDFKSGAADFLEKGPANEALGIQVKIAAPLLADFINTTDRFVNGNDTSHDAILRFTHAEAISPFAALLGIPEASISSPSVFDYQKNWKVADIIPLSANIQWILYSNGKNCLVKVLINEREVQFPVLSASPPYYDWNELRKYFVERMQLTGATLNDDMVKYLAGVK